MAISKLFQTYYAIDLEHLSESWGSNTYTKILVKEYPDSALVSTVSTQSADVTFLYPHQPTNVYYLDGVAEGHITLVNWHAADTTTVTGYTVRLRKTDNTPDNETTLGTYTGTISTGNTISAAGGELRLPIFMNIDGQKVGEDEKLLLNITYNSSGGTPCVKHELDSADPDIKIKIPYASTG